MKLLLDTHTFIWWDSDPAKLSAQALAHCQDRQNALLLSVATIRVSLSYPTKDRTIEQRAMNATQPLSRHLRVRLRTAGLATSAKRRAQVSGEKPCRTS